MSPCWAFVVVVVLASLPRGARADLGEARLYLDLDGRVLWHDAGTLHLQLRPMGRSEQRFREEGLVFVKSFLGARLDLFPWLLFQLYYAHKDLLYPDTPRRQAHMAVLDPIFKVRLGPIRLLDRNGFEWHITDGFSRYRHYLEGLWRLPWPPVHWLALFAGGELRVDSDEARVNMLDLRAGLEVRPADHVFARPFYYLEAKRRGAPAWRRTHILGLLLAVRL